METVLLIVHILVCIFIIVSILMQASKGGGLAGAFGGAGGQAGAMFGGAGAGTFLSKVTTWLAVVFFLTCIGLWHFSRTTDTLPETAAERMLKEQGAPVPLQGVEQPQSLGGTEPAAPAQSAPAEEKPAGTGN